MKKYILICAGFFLCCIGSAHAACWDAWVAGDATVFKGSTHTYTAGFSASCGSPQIIDVTKKIKYKKPNNTWTSYTTGATRSISFTQSGSYQVKANYVGTVEKLGSGGKPDIVHDVNTNRYKTVYSCSFPCM